jgi:hypothetical protein
LISNIDFKNSDLSVQSLRLLSDLYSLVYQKQVNTLNNETKKQFKTILESQFIDMIEKLLIQADPIPLFTITIILVVLSNDTTFLNQFKAKGILPLILKLLIVNKSLF